MRFTSILLVSTLFVATQAVQVKSTTEPEDLSAEPEAEVNSLEDTDGSMRSRRGRPTFNWSTFLKNLRQQMAKRAKEQEEQRKKERESQKDNTEKEPKRYHHGYGRAPEIREHSHGWNHQRGPVLR